MRSAHKSEPLEEHRIIVDMTPLEAVLYLKGQPVVLREVRARIRKALDGCDGVPYRECVR